MTLSGTHSNGDVVRDSRLPIRTRSMSRVICRPKL